MDDTSRRSTAIMRGERDAHLFGRSASHLEQNRGGNRQLNRALHTIALTQVRTDPRAKAYMTRRRAEGKSWLEALRCLKRHLADVVLRTMLADAQAGPVLRA